MENVEINIVKTYVFWHIIQLLDYILMDTFEKTRSILQLTQDFLCGLWQTAFIYPPYNIRHESPRSCDMNDQYMSLYLEYKI